MEVFFLIVLLFVMASALASGFPVAFALPGAAIITMAVAGISGYIQKGYLLHDRLLRPSLVNIAKSAKKA